MRCAWQLLAPPEKATPCSDSFGQPTCCVKRWCKVLFLLAAATPHQFFILMRLTLRSWSLWCCSTFYQRILDDLAGFVFQCCMYLGTWSMYTTSASIRCQFWLACSRSYLWMTGKFFQHSREFPHRLGKCCFLKQKITSRMPWPKLQPKLATQSLFLHTYLQSPCYKWSPVILSIRDGLHISCTLHNFTHFFPKYLLNRTYSSLYLPKIKYVILPKVFGNFVNNLFTSVQSSSRNCGRLCKVAKVASYLF